MIQYGIWSPESGGFIESGFWDEAGRQRATKELENHLGDDPEASVKRICDVHEENRTTTHLYYEDQSEPGDKLEAALMWDSGVFEGKGGVYTYAWR